MGASGARVSVEFSFERVLEMMDFQMMRAMMWPCGRLLLAEYGAKGPYLSQPLRRERRIDRANFANRRNSRIFQRNKILTVPVQTPAF